MKVQKIKYPQKFKFYMNSNSKLPDLQKYLQKWH